jgi:hypothetical protein
VQREVEVEIEGVDKGGTFLGTLTLTSGPKPMNLGVTLLRSGLARLQPFFHDDVKGAREMIAAQDAAKQARLKVGPLHRLFMRVCSAVEFTHALWQSECPLHMVSTILRLSIN